MQIFEQDKLTTNLTNILKIYKHSDGKIRPHFILTGPSGSGKSYIIEHLAETHKIDYLEVNAAQLTKEGTAGNSLSKALTPLANSQGNLVICFVDEFDKLFISGNSNTALAHESTNGVQNEFLRVLEAESTSVFADYGKYKDISVSKVLFIFAGAFNGEDEISIDKLRALGVKTEFLGRVGLIFNTSKLSLETLLMLLDHSELLKDYLKLYPGVIKDTVIDPIKKYLVESYAQNTIGIRLINTLIHRFFINDGKLEDAEVEQVSFQTKLTLNSNQAKQNWKNEKPH